MTAFALLILMLHPAGEPGRQVSFGAPILVFENEADCMEAKREVLAAYNEPAKLKELADNGVSWVNAGCVPAIAAPVAIESDKPQPIPVTP